MSRWLSILLLSLLAALPAQAASAQETADRDRFIGVVELFTSQGCSSCPPADAALGKLVKAGDVLALSFHVDYWNYLGWEDTLSLPESTARQRAYAKMLERRSVYTPQAVINGRDHINGADLAGIRAKLAGMKAGNKGLTVDVDIVRDDDSLSITAGNGRGKGNLVLVVFDRRNDVPVGRGENRGRTITYNNSVRSIQTIGMWDGSETSVTLPASVVADWTKQGCAVLLQTMHDETIPAEIVGAAMLVRH